MAVVEPRKVKCPQCGGPAVYAAENAFRPFCSQRCKMIDLGNWASENYRVPLAEDPTSSDQNDTA